MKKIFQKNKWIFVLFMVLLIGYSIMMYWLFYRQCFNVYSTDYFRSDMLAYMQTALGQESGYHFPYPIFFWCIKLFLPFMGIENATAVATTGLNSLSVILTVYYINRLLADSYENYAKKKQWISNLLGIIAIIAGFSIFFISMLYAPKGIYLPGMDHKYLGVFSANPYHNATYMATRPFSVLAFFSLARIFQKGKEKTNWKDNILFGISLLLTTMTKPSFTLVLVITAGIIMLWRFVRAKAKNWTVMWQLGICFIPTGIDLLYQYAGVFGAGPAEETGMGFGFCDAWLLYCHNIPFAIVLGLAFPGWFLLFNLKELKTNSWYRLSWQLVIVALSTFVFLYEKGERFDDLNFSWGYMHAIFFVFLTSLTVLIRNTLERKGHWLWLTTQWLAYGWHLACGIAYFIYIYNGEYYYCF